MRTQNNDWRRRGYFDEEDEKETVAGVPAPEPQPAENHIDDGE